MTQAPRSRSLAPAAISPMHEAGYRRDIDGLRAVAVLAVVAFHAFPTALPGGFAGVDIFFVISGYLITGVIERRIDEGSFTFADFYARRIRRISTTTGKKSRHTGPSYRPPERSKAMRRRLRWRLRRWRSGRTANNWAQSILRQFARR